MSPDSVNVRAFKPAIVGKFIEREHAVGVHVADPLVHVEAAGTQLGVGARVEAPLLARPADRGGHAERRAGRLALEDPLVDALRVRTTLGASSSHFAGTWFWYMSGGSIMWSSMLTRIMSSSFMPCSSPAGPAGGRRNERTSGSV